VRNVDGTWMVVEQEDLPPDRWRYADHAHGGEMP
jgi:hypothetical protein